ncbi:uncharacterized protein LOC112269949 [Brachypodium distachyon]|uniref:uncharacterized protein LOC112269949 n=1 Tax=Brachypodium distachyon TaxID=15368 RepID=UPI000D0CE85C|nr:uncharacterized protein LOC112269949 [Brachypodium distachyon]|eukprot:XP_024313269.1 uncharacterized protein LOC112269949 [Brachypodium distachyon]
MNVPLFAVSGSSPAASLLDALAGAGEAGEAPPASLTAVQGTSAPTSGTGATVVDLDPVAEAAGAEVEPEPALTSSPAVAETVAAVDTAAAVTAPGDASAAVDATGAGSPAAQQGTAPAGSKEASLVPGSLGASAGEVAGEGQQDPREQAGDPAHSPTSAAGASSSSAALPSTDLGTLAGVAWNPLTWDPSIFEQGHRFLDAVRDQQQAFVTSFNEVREHHAAAKNQLGECGRLWRENGENCPGCTRRRASSRRRRDWPGKPWRTSGSRWSRRPSSTGSWRPSAWSSRGGSTQWRPPSRRPGSNMPRWSLLPRSGWTRRVS